MACATSSLPPFCKYVVMPVARDVWQVVLVFMPASSALRWNHHLGVGRARRVLSVSLPCHMVKRGEVGSVARPE